MWLHGLRCPRVGVRQMRRVRMMSTAAGLDRSPRPTCPARELARQRVAGSKTEWDVLSAVAPRVGADDRRSDGGDKANDGAPRYGLQPTVAVVLSTRTVHCSADGAADTRAGPAEQEPGSVGLPARFQEALNAVFFPKGWPASTTSNFRPYCGWQFVANTTGTVTGVLSMQALLYAVGVGAGAVPLAAAINWVLKDGLGQLGGVLYGARYGNRFDADPKRHRMAATVALQASTLLEVLTPMVPHLFLPLASISNVGKNISWLASSATRAQMHYCFALQGNLGDITAKITSQTIAASLVGTALGIAVSKVTGDTATNVLAAFIPFSLVSLYATKRSCEVVWITTLNVQRAELLMHRFIAQQSSDHSEQLVPSPEEISRHELFIQKYNSIFTVPLLLSARLASAIPDVTDLEEVLTQRTFERAERYYIAILTPDEPSVALWFADDASAEDKVAGLYHACLLRYRLAKSTEQHGSTCRADIHSTHREAMAHLPTLLSGLQATGWDLQAIPFAENAATLSVP